MSEEQKKEKLSELRKKEQEIQEILAKKTKELKKICLREAVRNPFSITTFLHTYSKSKFFLWFSFFFIKPYYCEGDELITFVSTCALLKYKTLSCWFLGTYGKTAKGISSILRGKTTAGQAACWHCFQVG